MATKQTFRARMQAARGTRSVEEITFAMRDYVYGKPPSVSTVRRLEKGSEATADAMLVLAFAKACGVTVESISPQIAEYLSEVAQRNSGWMYGTPGQSFAPTNRVLTRAC